MIPKWAEQLDAYGRTSYYDAYLQSEQWWSRRRLMYAWTNWACEFCGDHGCGLHIHHLHYRTLGRETPRDLLCLCEDCHTKAHWDMSQDQREAYQRIVESLAEKHPLTWSALAESLGYEPREDHARRKLAALAWRES